MKKFLSIAFITAITALQFACSTDEVQQESSSLKAKESRHQIVLSEDWPDIEKTMIDFAEANSIPSNRFGIFCYTKGINYAFVQDYRTEEIYKVTWTGGLTYTVTKVDLNYALEQCRTHLDPSYYLD